MEIVLQELQIGRILNIFAKFVSAPGKLLRRFGKALPLLQKALHLGGVSLVDPLQRVVEQLPVYQHLLCRIDLHRLHIVHRPLGVDIKGTDGVHLCIEKLYSIRVFGVRRKDVDDAASDRKLSSGVHDLHSLIAQFHKAFFDQGQIDVAAHGQLHGSRLKDAVRRYLFYGSRNRRDDDTFLSRPQRLQDLQPFVQLIVIFRFIPQENLLFRRQHQNFLLRKKRKI